MLALGAASAAAAEESEVPDDVAEAFAGPVIEEIQGDELTDEDAPDFSGNLRAVAVQPIFMFDENFYEGVPDEPLTETGEWIAALVRDDTVIGTATVWKPSGVVEVAGYDNDAPLGNELRSESGKALVRDEPVGAYYWYDRPNQTFTPANDPALVQVAGPAPLKDVQAAVVERTRAAQADGRDDVVGGQSPTQVVGGRSWLPLVGGLALLAGGLALLAHFWRGRTGHTESSSPASGA
ncbi:hypothetical protein HGK34_18490 [Myceligenerans sp. I2]|uniref:Uncharacterized protein n=1 Tax=Myceligenerans indicum TaxID=2593663 RepID=A0ABS1LPY6_9MICO|nr:hypothetical protein [Myceligenerans indicum]